MGQKRVATISIRADGTKDVKYLSDAVDELNDGLHALDSANAREALNTLRSIDKTTLNQIKAQIKSVGKSLKNFGDSIASVGKKLTVALTAPIVGATYAIGKFGLNIDSLKNQLIAFEGSSEKAEFRLKSLRELVDQTAGATRNSAYEIYGLLKPLEASDKAIDKTIVALGRLKLGFKNMIPGDFAYNLTQIFGQNFEEQDIKQAIGQVPNFRQYLVKAFGTGDNETLSEMKKSGKITMESFFIGIADAIQNDTVLAGLQEPVALRMQKFIERAFESVEPIANKIVDILAKIIEFATPYLEKFSGWFKSLSPFAQNAAIAIAGFAAALGPVLVALGSLTSFFAPIITGLLSIGVSITAAGGLFAFLATAIGTLGTFITSVLLPALVGLAPVFLAVGAVLAVTATAVIALYTAWQTNFAGIKDTTFQVWDAVKSVTSTVLGYINGIVQTVGGQIVSWWKENYPLIKEIVLSVSETVKSIIDRFLSAIQSFWETHGERITSFVKTSWNIISSVIIETTNTITEIIRFALQIINGNWSDAWETLLGIFQSAAKNLVIIWKGAHDLFIKALAALIPIVAEYGTKITLEAIKWTTKISVEVVKILATLPVRIIQLIPQFVSAGVSIIGAIWKGIKEGWSNSAQSDSLNIPINFTGGNIPKPINYDRPQDISQLNKIPLLNVGQLSQDSEKLRKEREVLAKAELSAQIALFANQAEQIKSIYERAFKEVVESFKETNDPTQFQSKWQQLKNWYETQVGELIPAWDNLVHKQTLAEKKGQFERELAFREHRQKIDALQNDTTEKAAEVQKLLTAKTKKETDERIKIAEDAAKQFQDAQNQIANTGFSQRVSIGVEVKTLVEQINLGRELNSVEQQIIKNQAELTQAEHDWQNAGRTTNEIQTLRNLLMGEQEELLKRLTTLEETKARIKADKDKTEAAKAYNDIVSGLNDEIQKLNVELGLSAELSRADAISKQLQGEAYKNLTKENKDLIISKASEIDQLKNQKEAVKKLKEEWGSLKGEIKTTLEYLTKGDFKGLFRSITDRFKDNFLEKISSSLATNILGFDPKQTDNPIAKPIVKEISTTNKLLSGIAAKLGVNPTGLGVSGIGSIVSQITGGGSAGSGFNLGSIFGGNAGNGIYNLGDGSRTGDIVNDVFQVVGGDKGRGNILSNLKGVFGKEGSFWGSEGRGNNVGTYGAIGGVASMVGGLFGDSRIGGLISGAGQGLALGAQIGSFIPGVGTAIGAGVGAAIGGLIGLFSSGGKAKKADKQQLPQFRQGLVDSISQFRQLISDLEGLRIDSSSALQKGQEIRSQIQNSFGLNWQSKKYRKVARKEISSQLNLIDQPGGLMEQLKAAAERRRQAEEFNNQFVATFAGGGYTDAAFMNQYGAFKQQYGLLKGGTPGVDSIPVLAMQGELFLNKNQQSDIIRGAGYDVFSHASIPNYPGSPKPTKMATGGFVGSGNISFAGASGGSVVIEELHIHLDTKLGVSEQSAAEITNIGLKTADGKKAIVKTIRTHVAEAGANSDGLKRDILQK